MPFPPNKTAKELGIDTSRKFVVVESDNVYKKGDILVIHTDDETSMPFFSRLGEENKNRISWSKLEYADEPKKMTIKEAYERGELRVGRMVRLPSGVEGRITCIHPEKDIFNVDVGGGKCIHCGSGGRWSCTIRECGYKKIVFLDNMEEKPQTVSEIIFKEREGIEREIINNAFDRLSFAVYPPLNKPLTKKIMNIFKSEPHKSLRKAGLIDDDDMPTDKGIAYFIAWQLQDKDVAKKFKTEVADVILEDK